MKDRCNDNDWGQVVCKYQFQSSPALKDRCNGIPIDQAWEIVRVSILTGLERPVQQGLPLLFKPVDLLFQSSPALKDRCNGLILGQHRIPITVSILTGLERPVQQLPDYGTRAGLAVSILTGLERPVQHSGRGRSCLMRPGFQSSPALKDRCNGHERNQGQTELRVSILTGLERPVQLLHFTSSQPSGKVSILTGLERPVQRGCLSRAAAQECFNPHRP